MLLPRASQTGASTRRRCRNGIRRARRPARESRVYSFEADTLGFQVVDNVLDAPDAGRFLGCEVVAEGLVHADGERDDRQRIPGLDLVPREAEIELRFVEQEDIHQELLQFLSILRWDHAI